MADKNFKVKSGLNIPITSAAILTTDSSGNISSTAVLPITAGGTGQTSATNAINALLPVQNGSTVNYVIQSDGTNINWGKLYNQTIKNNGTTVTPRGNINVIGATFADDSGTDTTTITFTDTTGVSTSGGSTITTSSASVIGLIVKGSASQTADLTQWRNSSGTVNARIDAYGTFQNGTATGYGAWINVQPAQASDKGIIVRGAASQTANLTEWQNSAGTVIANITPNGGLHVSSNITQSSAGRTFIGGTGDHSAFLNVSIPTASRPGIVIRANNASQTANLQEWQNSSGAVVASIDSLGKITSHNRDTAGGNNNLTISGYYNGSTSSLDLQSNGITRASLISSGTIGTDSSFRIHTRINDVLSERFRIATTGRVGFNTNNPSSGLHFLNTIASDVGIIVQGAASQTANLQEWQNSSGTVLAKVDASGSMFTTTAAAGTNTTQIATTAFVKTAIDNLVDSAPGTLDTLNEIAAALNDDPNFYTTITTLTSALENNDVYNYMGVF